MSSFNLLDIVCEQCREEFKGTVWTAVHAAQDPELKDLLLGGELNILTCPQCAHPAYQDHFVLYQDPAAEIIAYIYPPSQESDRKFLESSMLTNFREVQKTYLPQDRQSYEPFIIFGLETFVEMMEEEEIRAEESQIAEAICKERGIPYHVLRPSEARRLQTVRVIPGATRKESDVIKGLKALLAVNPKLDLYIKMAGSLGANV